MANSLKNIPKEILWPFIVELREIVKSNFQNIEFIVIIFREDEYTFFLNEIPPLSNDDKILAIALKRELKFHLKSTLFLMDDHYALYLTRNELLAAETIDFLVSYLPFCFIPIKAFHLKRTVTLLHFAQTLDGRIAANNGHSKWIGNEENLIHAHRLRALFDGILIGSNTLEADKPRLNVRLVKGPNPTKVVIGNNSCKFESLLENQGKVIFVTSGKDIHNNGIETIYIPKVLNKINPEIILQELYKRGICSLFIEGGAYTASSFLSAKSIDLLQLFISPKILGSGIASFSLQEITHINDSIQFSSRDFKPMGDGMLFSGEINY